MKPIDQLRAIIAAKAATPQGFEIARDAKEHSDKSAQYECKRQLDAGTLHRAKLSHTHSAYFATVAARNAFLTLHAAEIVAPGPKAIHIAKRKPEPARPHKDAAIVFPKGYKHTIIPTPMQRNHAITHSFFHDGMGAM